MSPLKILVNGGGVAGTALGFWLSHMNHHTTIVERHPTLRTSGLQVDVRSHGIEVLKRMGLEAKFKERKAPEEGMQLIDLQGRKRAYLAANKSGEGPQGITSEYEIMRGDLCQMNVEASGGNVRYIFDQSIKEFTERDDYIEVEFQNGEKENYDLLVGCDGIWSSTRKLMLGAEASDNTFHPLNETNAYMTFKTTMQPEEKYIGQMYVATGSRAMLLRRHSPEEMQLLFLLGRDGERLRAIKRGDIEKEKEAMAGFFKGAGWRSDEMVGVMMGTNDFYAERLGNVRMEKWHSKRVVLLGDAAYALGGSGMGTTMALVGAYILAGEIARHCGPSEAAKEDKNASEDKLLDALEAYEACLRPYIIQVQSSVGGSLMGWLPSSAWGIGLLHFALETFLWLPWDLIAQFFTKGNKDPWQLPEYKELSL